MQQRQVIQPEAACQQNALNNNNASHGRQFEAPVLLS